jgi:hypothetical protein
MPTTNPSVACRECGLVIGGRRNASILHRHSTTAYRGRSHPRSSSWMHILDLDKINTTLARQIVDLQVTVHISSEGSIGFFFF